MSIVLVKSKTTDEQGVVKILPDPPVKRCYGRVFGWGINRIRRLRKVQTDPKYYFFNLYEQDSFLPADRIISSIGIIPDIVLVHWVANFCNSKTIAALHEATGARIIFMPADMSTFTGGCHYAWNCDGYTKDCGDCPAITTGNKARASKNLRIRGKELQKVPLEIAVGTTLLRRQAEKSTLFRNAIIHSDFLGVPDRGIYRPADKELARRKLGLPQGVVVALAGALNLKEERKGFHIFKESIKLLEPSRNSFGEKVVIVLMGSGGIDIPSVSTIVTGYISTEEGLAAYYQAADFLVSPSLEDSGPMMINQAISCGTPVLAFETGVALDLVTTGSTGYLARLGDPKSLATGFEYMINLNSNERVEMRENCIRVATEKMIPQAILALI